MSAYQLTIQGAAIPKALYPVAYAYAVLSLQRVCTVRWAPEHTPEDERRWRDYRDTLRTIGVDLPAGLDNYEWTPRFDLSKDFTRGKRTRVNVGGLMQYTRVEGSHVRSGAKKIPSWTREEQHSAAKRWAEDFVSTLDSVYAARIAQERASEGRS